MSKMSDLDIERQERQMREKPLFELVTLQHYPEDSQRGGPKDNWKVLFGGPAVQQLTLLRWDRTPRPRPI